MLYGQLIENKAGFPAVVDQYGDQWDVYTDDASGNYAIQRDAGERWEAATFDEKLGTISKVSKGATFGVNCQDEYVAKQTDSAGSLAWAEND